MNWQFYKYQGTGNDFVIIDNRNKTFLQNFDTNQIQSLCNRRLGIGADGLILLENSSNHDFKMVYFNADGQTSSMCGNGGRCIVAFAKKIGLIENQCTFEAIDGLHEAKIDENNWAELKMKDVTDIKISGETYILDTGSPHFVQFVEQLKNEDVVQTGRRIRYSAPFKEKGINVNLVEIKNNDIEVATYERGVEDETLSCGTGVTACAIAYLLQSKTDSREINIKTKGGQLAVRFTVKDKHFSDIWLCGGTQFVFQGTI